MFGQAINVTGADLGEGYRDAIPPPEMTCGFLEYVIFFKKNENKDETTLKSFLSVAAPRIRLCAVIMN